jgi:hypothetical protein
MHARHPGRVFKQAGLRTESIIGFILFSLSSLFFILHPALFPQARIPYLQTTTPTNAATDPTAQYKLVRRRGRKGSAGKARGSTTDTTTCRPTKPSRYHRRTGVRDGRGVSTGSKAAWYAPTTSTTRGASAHTGVGKRSGARRRGWGGGSDHVVVPTNTLRVLYAVCVCVCVAVCVRVCACGVCVVRVRGCVYVCMCAVRVLVRVRVRARPRIGSNNAPVASNSRGVTA